MSSIAQIFDPLGLLAPVILRAKLIVQELWKIRIDWDESLPAVVANQWIDYATDVKRLDGFSMRRRFGGSNPKVEIQLHGFCDASERAYGACIFVRIKDNQGAVQANLTCAKSRVAPFKTLLILRLELCGAQLLAQLMNKVRAALEVNVSRAYYWTSSIVLYWIRAVNKKLPVFVAHRVGEIQEITSVDDWRHVRSEEKAADILSRGCDSEELINSRLW